MEVSEDHSGGAIADGGVEVSIADRAGSGQDCQYMDEKVPEEDSGGAIADGGVEVSIAGGIIPGQEREDMDEEVG